MHLLWLAAASVPGGAVGKDWHPPGSGKGCANHSERVSSWNRDQGRLGHSIASPRAGALSLGRQGWFRTSEVWELEVMSFGRNWQDLTRAACSP